MRLDQSKILPVKLKKTKVTKKYFNFLVMDSEMEKQS